MTSAVVQVQVTCVELQETVSVELSSFDSQTAQFEAIRNATAKNGSRWDTAFDQLVRLDDSGWGVEIDFHGETEPLKTGDVLEVRLKNFAFIGAKHLLRVIASEDRFNESIQKKIVQLEGDYVGYRKIRGDGNCYYRAVIFGLIEKIILSGNRYGFKRIRECFSPISFIDIDESKHHNDLLYKLDLASEGKEWHSLPEFEAEMLMELTNVNCSLVRACKQLVAKNLIGRQAEMFNGLSLGDAILFTYIEEISSLEEFCDKYVLKDGVCAEGAHVNVGLLPQALGCESHIVILSRERSIELSSVHTELAEGDQQESLGTIHLLLRPGHYDLLYPNSESPLPPAPAESVDIICSSPQNEEEKGEVEQYNESDAHKEVHRAECREEVASLGTDSAPASASASARSSPRVHSPTVYLEQPSLQSAVSDCQPADYEGPDKSPTPTPTASHRPLPTSSPSSSPNSSPRSHTHSRSSSPRETIPAELVEQVPSKNAPVGHSPASTPRTQEYSNQGVAHPPQQSSFSSLCPTQEPLPAAAHSSERSRLLSPVPAPSTAAPTTVRTEQPRSSQPFSADKQRRRSEERVNMAQDVERVCGCCCS